MLTPSQYWDREAIDPVTPQESGWMAHPIVRKYVNRNISGTDDGWPLDWFQATYRRKFARCLSIGCGTGALERDLLKRGIVDSVSAFDASPESLRIARAAAEAEGLSGRVDYYEADFNAAKLPRGEFDLICFHQSLHHVARLEHLFAQVQKALKPDGLLYLDEFVGPSRTDWNTYAIRWYSALYQLMPSRARYFETFAMPVQQEDPSEAIRSADILPCLRIGFEIEHFRGYGGNILALLFPDLRVGELSDDVVASLIVAEQALMACGDPSFHAVITATPKRGAKRTIAAAQYAVEARMPNLFRELRFLRQRYRRRV